METEAAAVLNLFDSCWFELNVLMKSSTIIPPKATSSAENLDHKVRGEEEEEEEISESASKLARIQTSTHSRSMSDQSVEATSFKHESMSPDSVLMIPSKLQTILSGKEATDSEEESHQNPSHEAVVLVPEKNMKKKKRRRETKSLSDLEFEELKGFMDLGFVFSEEDKDSTLASIIPGLQRLGKKESSDSDESMVQRPYLSEAWEVYCYDKKKKEKENPLMNWKFPAVNNETDIKDSLRWWAHTVASSVR
ncbi:uncharacterized protein LOC130965605 [Arachis stenosperma]|uniref:uncharacterized protein LOC130965605 n=1 Tax=Arachis stenosperma TaxID=217475 RepID=UPI0025AC6DE2|nr:uncharacterized protein LOC130965605 [Arachis stenosperma]